LLEDFDLLALPAIFCILEAKKKDPKSTCLFGEEKLVRLSK
jgi:hypothetical protein